MMASTARRVLYPAIEPFHTGFIQLDQRHAMYFEQCGKPDGHPVVVVHGGPGGGIAPFYRSYFDPAYYRIILFDQRGSGKSLPPADLVDNTTWHLVQDMETLRGHLGIDRWSLFGGSWGSTLSLAYAEKHTDRVRSLVLRGIFALRPSELQFFYQNGACHVFPEAFEAFRNHIPQSERHDLISAYHRRLTDPDLTVQLAAARAWSIWELSTSRLYIDPDYIKRATDSDQFALQFARIESHFFMNKGWLKSEEQLIDEAVCLQDTPAVIVQGRYDMVCPCRSAYDLSKVYTNAKLVIVPDAGHSCKEPGIIHELILATDSFKFAQ